MKDQNVLAIPALQINEPAYEVQQHLLGQDRFAVCQAFVEVGCSVLLGDIRVPCATISAPVRRQEAGLAVHQPGRHRDVVLIHRKVHDSAPLESQKRLTVGRAVLAIQCPKRRTRKCSTNKSAPNISNLLPFSDDNCLLGKFSRVRLCRLADTPSFWRPSESSNRILWLNRAKYF